jgi:hypothetical protein
MRVVRDVGATLLIAVVAATYVSVLAGSAVWFVADPRGVAALGLVLGLAACIVGGESSTVSSRGTWRTMISLAVTAAVALGVITVVTNNWAMVAIFMVVLALVWAATTARHFMTSARGPVSRRGPAHA